MENPISKKARSVIYLVGLIVTALGGVLSAILTLSGQEQFLPLAVQAISAVGIIMGIVARSNLQADTPVESKASGKHAADVQYDL